MVCLLFFQVVLLLGYLYAHLLTRAVPSRTQRWMHAALLGASILAVRILPRDSWKPAGPEHPAMRILVLLCVTVGLPYFLLSTASPLLQTWYAESRGGASPYRFYALSNAGSMLALISYPVLVEPFFSNSRQAFGWEVAYGALILRVDRTDLSKNIVRGFLAYERLLAAHPELTGDVMFWAFLQPSRQDIDDYRAYLGSVLSVARASIANTVAVAATPIRVEIEDNMGRAIAGYRVFDVLLVNPIYDGMNLVAKEGPLVNQRDGVLVLSENAGSHEELGEWAITVNPFDIDETAEAPVPRGDDGRGAEEGSPDKDSRRGADQ